MGKHHIETLLKRNPEAFRVVPGEFILEAQVWELATELPLSNVNGNLP